MPPVHRQPWTIQLEQLRQARRIHGGLLKLLIALLGIKLARLPLPSKRLRLMVYRGIFASKYPPGLNESEAERPLWAYPSLNAVFTRAIKSEFRHIEPSPDQIICPCDGTVQDIGQIENSKLLTVKGIEYTLASLLPKTDPRPFEGSPFVVIFLSPIDCHRIFSPHAAGLEEVVHVPGFRLLVHPPYQRAEYPPYTLNERMIFRLATPLGPCAVIMVAGFGVGNITLPFAPEFRPRARTAARKTWSPPLALRGGDWLATFELGSTVVLLGPPAAEVTRLVFPNEKVRYGQPLLSYGR
jgi:phosphatidylserine decarboxylase